MLVLHINGKINACKKEKIYGMPLIGSTLDLGLYKLLMSIPRWTYKEYKYSGPTEGYQIRENGKSVILKKYILKTQSEKIKNQYNLIDLDVFQINLHENEWTNKTSLIVFVPQNPMEQENFTTATEFIILGFPEFPELQIPLFFLFLLIYMIVLMGNLTIITIMCLDSHLHTPMYFFLGNLSFVDIFSTSVTLPKLLDILLRNNHHISMSGCFTQLYFFLSLTANEFLILSVMAYDRYVAICQPLCYQLIMNQKVCILFSTGTWILSFLLPAFYFIFIPHLCFCGSKEINHFFCDMSALLKLSCTSTSSIQTEVYIVGAVMAIPCFISTLTSYVYIISNILRIRSTEGKRKAFSTCSSHLTVVCLFYLTLVCLYMRPPSMQSMNLNKVIIILHNTLIPMFNPVIYSLKNKDVKHALGKIFY
uniref:Olfactory receptor 1009-like n=1 Tax=Geotrypetes seraphini TaxID=260995 RepID=A0A6P8PV15_GEOSA|nr:olfactory receptor 1009-like [Geotrypetes seraphini]